MNTFAYVSLLRPPGTFLGHRYEHHCFALGPTGIRHAPVPRPPPLIWVCPHPQLGVLGDGDPVDVVEIGSAKLASG